MASGRYLFTSESVSMGHPDKLADQVSDAVLDAILAEDPHGRVACETLVTAYMTGKALRVASHLLEVSQDDLSITDGRVHISGVPSSGLTLAELAGALAGVPGVGRRGRRLAATRASPLRQLQGRVRADRGRDRRVPPALRRQRCEAPVPSPRR